jgi:hypothetical protein
MLDLYRNYETGADSVPGELISIEAGVSFGLFS